MANVFICDGPQAINDGNRSRRRTSRPNSRTTTDSESRMRSRSVASTSHQREKETRRRRDASADDVIERAKRGEDPMEVALFSQEKGERKTEKENPVSVGFAPPTSEVARPQFRACSQQKRLGFVARIPQEVHYSPPLPRMSLVDGRTLRELPGGSLILTGEGKEVVQVKNWICEELSEFRNQNSMAAMDARPAKKFAGCQCDDSSVHLLLQFLQAVSFEKRFSVFVSPLFGVINTIL